MPNMRIILEDGWMIKNQNNFVGNIDYEKDIVDATFNELVADCWYKHNMPVVEIIKGNEKQWVRL